jgi:tetratricopeptide (TPR) repeat protein
LKEGETPDVALVLTHLGLLSTRTREVVQAASYFERALRILKANPSAHPLYLAVTSGCQGEFYGAQGMWAEAAASFETALRLKQKILGNSHPALVDTLASYSQALAKIRRKKEAKQYEEQAREIAVGYTEAASQKSATVDVRALRAER